MNLCFDVKGEEVLNVIIGHNMVLQLFSMALYPYSKLCTFDFLNYYFLGL